MSRGSMWILTIHRIWLGFLKSDLCSGYGLGRLRWSYWQAVRLICSAMTLRAGPVRVCQAGIRTMMEQPAYVCLILAAAAQRRVTQAKAARTRVPTVRAAQRAKPAEAREQPARRCQPADRRPQAVLSGPEVSPARCSRPAAVSRVAQPLQAAVPRRVAALLRVASPEASQHGARNGWCRGWRNHLRRHRRSGRQPCYGRQHHRRHFQYADRRHCCSGWQRRNGRHCRNRRKFQYADVDRRHC